MEDPTRSERLRRQRNWLAGSAVALLALTAMIALPRFLRWRAELEAADAELFRVQAAVLDRQEDIRRVQARILAAQREIAAERAR